MPPGDDPDRNDVAERSRSRKERPDDAGEGVRLPATDYTGEDGSGFLGVDEPTVPPDARGDTPPPPPLPGPDARRRP